MSIIVPGNDPDPVSNLRKRGQDHVTRRGFFDILRRFNTGRKEIPPFPVNNAITESKKYPPAPFLYFFRRIDIY
jgi:hypothetical protein